MTLTPEFLDQLKARLSLSEYIGSRLKLHRKGRLYLGLCPFHHEKSPSFTIYEDQGTYHCFGCGVHGDILTFAMEKDGLTFQEAVGLLAPQAGMVLPRETPKSEEEIDTLKALYDICEEGTRWYADRLTGRARAYLERRGLASEVIRQFRLGYAPTGNALLLHLKSKGFREEHLVDSGLFIRREDGSLYERFRDRVMFPITDIAGKVVAFGGRLMGPGEPKYLNSSETPIFHKGKNLYAYTFARKRPKGTPLLVVEGYMDVISLHQAGFQGAVAPLGTALTEDQIHLLWRGDDAPLLCLDGDAAGQKAAYRSAQRALSSLKPGKTLNFLLLPNGEDPDSVIRTSGPSFFEKLIRSPVPLIDLFWKSLASDHALKTPEDKAALAKKFNDFVKEIKDFAVQTQYREEINHRLRLLTRQARGEKTASNKNAYAYKSPGSTFRFDAKATQFKILMASVLLYPEILDQLYEEFMLLKCESPQLLNLKEEILEQINSNEKLDRDALKHHLYSEGFGHVYEDVTRVEVLTHAPFLKRASGKEDVVKGWRDLCEHMSAQSTRLQDKERLKEYFARHLTAESWEKVKETQSCLPKVAEPLEE